MRWGRWRGGDVHQPVACNKGEKQSKGGQAWSGGEDGVKGIPPPSCNQPAGAPVHQSRLSGGPSLPGKPVNP